MIPTQPGPPQPPPALQERVAYWQRRLGFTLPELRQALDRLPRLLLYPIHEPKYQAKLDFLSGAAGRRGVHAVAGWGAARGAAACLLAGAGEAGAGATSPSFFQPTNQITPHACCTQTCAVSPPPCPHCADELGLEARQALPAFPAFLTYSLPDRIAPRAAAARAFRGCRLPLEKLAVGEAAFIAWLRVEPEEFYAWRDEWQQGAGARWAAPDGGGGPDAAAGGGKAEER